MPPSTPPLFTQRPESGPAFPTPRALQRNSGPPPLSRTAMPCRCIAIRLSLLFIPFSASPINLRPPRLVVVSLVNCRPHGPVAANVYRLQACLPCYRHHMPISACLPCFRHFMSTAARLDMSSHYIPMFPIARLLLQFPFRFILSAVPHSAFLIACRRGSV